jgi:hypothetical protein
MTPEPDDFKALVRWATWQVIEGITSGQKLHGVMYGVLMATREWKLPAATNDSDPKQQQGAE